MKSYPKLSLSLFLCFFWATVGLAQDIYFPYYGKNKVLYDQFNWQSYETEHFRIYFYAEDAQTLKNIAEISESAYQKISQLLKHELSDPVPLIFYKTFTEFEQTNLFQISEGVLGVSEPLLYRVALHGDMPLDELQDLVNHELTHIFQFDLLWGSPGGVIYAVSQPALWVFEGLSEYNTQKWSSWSSLIVRDAVLNDRVPELTESGELFSRYPLPREPAYDFGHAIYELIEKKYGRNGIREFWHSMKSTPFLGKKDPLKKTFNLKPKEFNYEFKKFLRERFKEFLSRESPEDYSIPLGPEFPSNPYYFALSHALSPSGDIVAALTYNIKDYDIDVVLISTKDGSVIKNITKGYTTRYEYIKYEIDPSKGRNIAWSFDGDKIAFFARDGQKYVLSIIDALKGNTLKKIKIFVDQPSSPCFLPNNEEVLFTGFLHGIHDIFKVNLSTEEINNLTEDRLFEKAPAISPDGKLVAYSIRLDAYDKLFISPLEDFKKKTQLTFGRGNTISPQFSSDSKEIFFSGDEREAFNIYSLNLDSGELRRYGDVRTGNFFPSPLPYDSKKTVFCSFNKGAFQIFKGEFEPAVEKTLTFAEMQPEEKLKQFEPLVTLEVKEDKIQPYKGLGKLYLTTRPPIDAIVSTDGSIYGGSSIAFTDLLGDYNFYIMAYQVRSFRSYYFSYLNQKRRFQYMISAFQYTLFYYPPYAYYDAYYYNYLSYNDAIASRQITGLNVSAYYPFNKYYRAQATLGYYHYEEDYLDPYMNLYFDQGYGFFWNGNALSASFSLVGETTHFKYFGPIAGHTFSLSLTQAIPVSKSFLQNTTAELDLRKYLNLGADILLALRFDGFASRGKNPYIFYFGGNNQVRSSYYYNIIGNEGWYANAELRFPLVDAAATLIGQIGPVRGVFFFDIARAKIKGYPAKFYRYSEQFDDASFAVLPAVLEFDAIGSYGYGFEFFFLGLPVHLEFAKRLEFPDISRPFDFEKFGKFETKFWIGFDF